MNVIDIPEPAPEALYEEAVARYAAMVKSRAIAVHRIGAHRYPAFSGIRLLVVVDHVGVDNRFYFSALGRLPSRYHRLFLREPFILPAWSLRVMQYTRYRAPRLVTGRDVVEPYAPHGGSDEQWCRMLAWYCGYAAFASDVRASGALKGRATIASARGLRHLLSDACALVPEGADETYAARIEDLCASFSESDRAERVQHAWELFVCAFDRFDAALRERLGASNTAECVTRARGLLSGEHECADFDRDYAFLRARDIDGYHQELASLGFPYGHLFPAAAHPGALRPQPAIPLVDSLVHNVYRMRRRLVDYAAGA